MAPAASSAETEFTSPVIAFDLSGDELILSWNVELSARSELVMEARALYPGRATRYFNLGVWSANPAANPPRSTVGQKNEDGDVLTDTLRLSTQASEFQIRARFRWAGGGLAGRLKFLGLALSDRAAQSKGDLEPAASGAWGKKLGVPELSQMAYPGGEVWCSPAATAMVLGYWSQALGRDDLHRNVPDVAQAIYDRNWPGTGNWAFNTAYAGSFPGMRGYVTRFADISEIEDWVAKNVPVAASVSYGFLRGKSEKGDGHLVVCAGFTPDGQMIINDPGTRLNVQKIFPRRDFEKAWATSGNTVYLIYPVSVEPPADRFGHWFTGSRH